MIIRKEVNMLKRFFKQIFKHREKSLVLIDLEDLREWLHCEYYIPHKELRKKTDELLCLLSNSFGKNTKVKVVGNLNHGKEEAFEILNTCKVTVRKKNGKQIIEEQLYEASGVYSHIYVFGNFNEQKHIIKLVKERSKALVSCFPTKPITPSLAEEVQIIYPHQYLLRLPIFEKYFRHGSSFKWTNA